MSLSFIDLDLEQLFNCCIRFSRYRFGSFYAVDNSLCGLTDLRSVSSRASHYVLMQAPELTSKLDVQCLPLKRTAHCLVEMVRFELMTPCLQGRCSPN